MKLLISLEGPRLPIRDGGGVGRQCGKMSKSWQHTTCIPQAVIWPDLMGENKLWKGRDAFCPWKFSLRLKKWGVTQLTIALDRLSEGASREKGNRPTVLLWITNVASRTSVKQPWILPGPAGDSSASSLCWLAMAHGTGTRNYALVQRE